MLVKRKNISNKKQIKSIEKAKLNKSIQNSAEKGFDYDIISAAVYSSNLEGNSIDLNTFLKHCKKEIKPKK